MMATKYNKTKSPKGKRISKKSATGTSRNETLPPGHRFDDEIGDICGNLLLKAEVQRIEKPVSSERLFKAELRKIVSQRKFSKVATLFFASVLDLAQDNPLTAVCTKLLEVTYEEYCIVRRHMESFKEQSMKMRIDSLLNEAKGLDWYVDADFAADGMFPDTPFCCIAVHSGWEKKFNEEGRLMETMAVAIRTEKIGPFVELAYKHGLLFYREAKRAVYYHLKVHPDNNIPGIPMSPPSVQTKARD